MKLKKLSKKLSKLWSAPSGPQRLLLGRFESRVLVFFFFFFELNLVYLLLQSKVHDLARCRKSIYPDNHVSILSPLVKEMEPTCYCSPKSTSADQGAPPVGTTCRWDEGVVNNCTTTVESSSVPWSPLFLGPVLALLSAPHASALLDSASGWSSPSARAQHKRDVVFVVVGGRRFRRRRRPEPSTRRFLPPLWRDRPLLHRPRGRPRLTLPTLLPFVPVSSFGIWEMLARDGSCPCRRMNRQRGRSRSRAAASRARAPRKPREVSLCIFSWALVPSYVRDTAFSLRVCMACVRAYVVFAIMPGAQVPSCVRTSRLLECWLDRATIRGQECITHMFVAPIWSITHSRCLQMPR